MADEPCNEYLGLSRRGFLAGSLAVMGAAITHTSVTTRVAMADEGYSGDTLVVISLRGGFDGLSAVVPHGEPDYLRQRPTIAIPTNALLAADSLFGLHPAMAPLLPYWNDGTFGAVHAVGQPTASRSHFNAIEEMERAAPASSIRTGWIDRALGQRQMTDVFSAIQVGRGLPTKAFSGPQSELTIGSIAEFSLFGTDSDDDSAWARSERKRWITALNDIGTDCPPSVRKPTENALDAIDRVSKLPDASPVSGADYPDSDFGRGLRDMARLIKSNLRVQVACIDVGDWDMHEGLGQYADQGTWMARKLRELCEGLAAFARDLGEALNRTTVVTMSEFGRRVAENDSGGVDHGLGNAMLLLGGSVVGGRVHGVWPGLEDAQLDDGDLAGANDFRVVLAEILSKRCHQSGLATVFPGADINARLGVVRG